MGKNNVVKRPSDSKTFRLDEQESEQADINLKAKRVTQISGLIPGTWDYFEVTARDADLNPTTIVYKTGGSGGTIIATITITYTVDGCINTISTS